MTPLTVTLLIPAVLILTALMFALRAGSRPRIVLSLRKTRGLRLMLSAFFPLLKNVNHSSIIQTGTLNALNKFFVFYMLKGEAIYVYENRHCFCGPSSCGRMFEGRAGERGSRSENEECFGAERRGVEE